MRGGGRLDKQFSASPAFVSRKQKQKQKQKQKHFPALTDEERRLFHNAMADVHPLVSDRAHFEAPLPPAIPRQREKDEALALEETLSAPLGSDLFLEGGDEAIWRRNGISLAQLRDLRRGRWVVEASLDLHGYTRDEARDALVAFILKCQVSQYRCVRIVHGKGQHSPGREPVLKQLVLNWLSHRQDVLAFCQARRCDGGAGAVTVQLQVAKTSRQSG